jgi:hypothetical protein
MALAASPNLLGRAPCALRSAQRTRAPCAARTVRRAAVCALDSDVRAPRHRPACYAHAARCACTAPTPCHAHAERLCRSQLGAESREELSDKIARRKMKLGKTWHGLAAAMGPHISPIYATAALVRGC